MDAPPTYEEAIASHAVQSQPNTVPCQAIYVVPTSVNSSFNNHTITTEAAACVQSNHGFQSKITLPPIESTTRRSCFTTLNNTSCTTPNANALNEQTNNAESVTTLGNNGFTVTNRSARADSNGSSCNAQNSTSNIFLAPTLTDMKVLRLFVLKVVFIWAVGAMSLIPLQLPFYFVWDLKMYISGQHGNWVFYASLGVFFVTSIALYAHRNNRRTHPRDKILLVVHHFVLSFFLAATSSSLKTYVVMMVTGEMVLSFFVLCLYCHFSRTCFTKLRLQVLAFTLPLFHMFLGVLLVFLLDDKRTLILAGGLSAASAGLTVYLTLSLLRVIEDAKYKVKVTQHWWVSLHIWTEIIFAPLFLIFFIWWLLSRLFNCEVKK